MRHVLTSSRHPVIRQTADTGADTGAQRVQHVRRAGTLSYQPRHAADEEDHGSRCGVRTPPGFRRSHLPVVLSAAAPRPTAEGRSDLRVPCSTLAARQLVPAPPQHPNPAHEGPEVVSRLCTPSVTVRPAAVPATAHTFEPQGCASLLVHICRVWFWPTQCPSGQEGRQDPL